MSKKFYVVDVEDGYSPRILPAPEGDSDLPAMTWRNAKKDVRAWHLNEIAKLRKLKEKDIKE